MADYIGNSAALGDEVNDDASYFERTDSKTTPAFSVRCGAAREKAPKKWRRRVMNWWIAAES